MARKKDASAERIRGFSSLANHEAGEREGTIIVAEGVGYKFRRIWHDGEWWHSVVDVIGALTEQQSLDGARNYWKVTKKRLTEEGAVQSVTDCNQLRLPAADGKLYKTDCATTATLFRIIESVPSPKAEPIKRFLAETGAERLEEMAQPSKAIDRAIEHYREKGRDNVWIDHRLQNISARNELTDQWAKRGVDANKFGEVTHDMSVIAMGIGPAKHKERKGLKSRDELREHMEKPELAITTLSETAAKAIIVKRDTAEFEGTREASIDGAEVARVAREALEKQLGRPVASKHNFLPKPDGSDTPLFAAAKNTKGARPESSRRFIETARELGVDESEKGQEKASGKVGQAKTGKRPAKKK